MSSAFIGGLMMAAGIIMVVVGAMLIAGGR
jgi:hypothetical protein